MTGEKPTVSIITGITDGYDTLKTFVPQIGVNVEWLAVTDGHEIAEPGHGWEIVNFESFRPTAEDCRHPNRLAKLPKCQPWLISDAPYSIWIDGSYRVTSPLFAVQAIACAHPIAQFIHPWRDCVYAEAEASRELIRYEGERQTLGLQQCEYRELGHPDHWGLWATGVIVRHHTHDVKIMGSQWLHEIRRWSYQDQVSEPVSLRLCDLRPTPLPGDHLNNPWLKYEGSVRHA